MPEGRPASSNRSSPLASLSTTGSGLVGVPQLHLHGVERTRLTDLEILQRPGWWHDNRAPSASIDLDGGETVTCTFTNTFVPGGNPVGGTAGLLEVPNSLRGVEAAPSSVFAAWQLALAVVGVLAVAASGFRLAYRRLTR